MKMELFTLMIISIFLFNIFSVSCYFFSDILKDEMIEIALGIAKNNGYLKIGNKDEKMKRTINKRYCRFAL